MSRTQLTRAGLVSAGIVVLQALLVLWFAWAAEKTAPRDLPIVVAGPAPAAEGLAERLRAARPGAFEIDTVADAAAADAALRDRTAYAAFVVKPGGVNLHVASAASPAVATLLGQAAQQVGNGRPVPVTDVIAAPADDPRGAGFAAGFLPLVLTSLAAGAALVVLIPSATVRIAGLLGFATVAGLVAAGTLTALGVLTGGYLAAAGVIGLLALAISATVAGLGAAIGRAGFGLGALLIFIIGGPISGVGAAPELLPQPWGDLGQLLPQGAGATLLRSVAFFDGAGSSVALGTLLGWVVLGLGLTLLARRRRRPARPSERAERVEREPVRAV